MKRFYLIAAIVGAISPYATYFGYLAAYPGASGALSLVWASAISAATLVDFTISCLVFWPFVFVESKRLNIKWPLLFIISNIVIGLSFALPLFLYCREIALEKNQHDR